MILKSTKAACLNDGSQIQDYKNKLNLGINLTESRKKNP